MPSIINFGMYWIIERDLNSRIQEAIHLFNGHSFPLLHFFTKPLIEFPFELYTAKNSLSLSLYNSAISNVPYI